MTGSDMLSPKVEKHVSQLQEEGWCVIEGIIPKDKVGDIRRSVEAGYQQAKRDYEALGGNLTDQKNRDGTRGKNAIAYVQPIAPYLADRRVLDVVENVLHPPVRISQTEIQKHILPMTEQQKRDYRPVRGYHSDWPHDLRDRERAGCLRQPFPDVTAGLITLWMLSPFTRENGATWVVPGSHRVSSNPRGRGDKIDESHPIEGEIQATGSVGSVLVFDSRMWHSGGDNLSDKPRVTVLVRYAPWWLNVEFGNRNQSQVPVEVYETFPEDVKRLYRHRVKGVANRL